MATQSELLPELRLRATAKGVARFALPFCVTAALFIWRVGFTPGHGLSGNGWFLTAIVVALLLFLIRPLVQPSTLTLDADGFTWAGGEVRRKPKTRWCDVLELGLAPGRYGGQNLGFNYRLGLGPYDPVTQANMRRMQGYDSILPDIFQPRPQELLATFQRYLEASHAAQGAAEADKEPWAF